MLHKRMLPGICPGHTHWTLLSVQWAMFCSAFVFGFLYLWINLSQAAKNSAAFRGDGSAWRPAFFPDPMRSRSSVSIFLPVFSRRPLSWSGPAFEKLLPKPEE